MHITETIYNTVDPEFILLGQTQNLKPASVHLQHRPIHVPGHHPEKPTNYPGNEL
jgi:hypothetical protein